MTGTDHPRPDGGGTGGAGGSGAVRPRYGLAWGFGLVGVLVSCALGVALSRWAERQDKARFAHEAGLLASMIEQKMERYESALARLRDACSPAGGRVSAATWGTWLSGTLDVANNYPGIGAVMVASREPGSGEVSGAKPEDRFVVRHSTGYGRLKPPRVGEDLMDSTDGRPAFRGALPATFGWVTEGISSLPKEGTAGETGFWYVVPLRDPEPAASILWKSPSESDIKAAARRARERAARANGLLAAFIRGDRFLYSFNHTNTQMAHVWLFPSRDVRPGDRPFNPTLIESTKPAFTEDVVMRWYGRGWTARFVSTPLFESGSMQYRAWLAWGLGMFLSLSGGGALAWQARSHANGLTLARKLAEAQKRQEALNRDLHDGTLQSVYGIGLGLERAKVLVGRDPDAAAGQLNETGHAIQRVIGELRQLIRSSGMEDPVGPPFSEVIRAVVDAAQVASAARIGLQIHPDVDRGLGSGAALHLVNIVREGLSNSIRHSGAETIRIGIRRGADGSLELEVIDDGRGFDAKAGRSEGLGLANLEARVKALGGRHGIERCQPSGTRLWVSIDRFAERQRMDHE